MTDSMITDRAPLWTVALAAALCSTSLAQTTSRESLATGGAEAHGSSTAAAISANGRYVAFQSIASDLVVGDSNTAIDVFVRDLALNSTVRVSVDSTGGQGNGTSGLPSISSNGRYVAFYSIATNLVTGDSNGASDVFVRDLQTSTTVRASVATGGAQGSGASFSPSISADGRYVAFYSSATNLVAGDTNAANDVFVRDLVALTTTRVSVDSGGTQATGPMGFSSVSPTISGDGRYVAFSSTATNLVSGDTNTFSDIFVRDTIGGTTTRMSVSSASVQADDGSYVPRISSDGRYVAFESYATNLVLGDTNGFVDIFRRDRQSNTTTRLSVHTNGSQPNDDSNQAAISFDGRFVTFESYATNLVSGDTNGFLDVFVRDTIAGSTTRLSVTTAGVQANDESYDPTISSDGRYAAYYSYATNLVAGDLNAVTDIFVRDQGGANAFTSFCFPGTNGVMACACGNPNGAGSGCANTGSSGATLSMTGTASLASDATDPGSVQMTGTNMLSGSTCIFLHGDLIIAAGAPFGAGVRCVGGQLMRLFLKTGLFAAGGTMAAPVAGDRSISNQAVFLFPGSPIVAGSTRYYQVYYRDPTQANPGGGCPTNDTFNITAGVAVTWGP